MTRSWAKLVASTSAQSGDGPHTGLELRESLTCATLALPRIWCTVAGAGASRLHMRPALCLLEALPPRPSSWSAGHPPVAVRCAGARPVRSRPAGAQSYPQQLHWRTRYPPALRRRYGSRQRMPRRTPCQWHHRPRTACLRLNSIDLVDERRCGGEQAGGCEVRWTRGLSSERSGRGRIGEEGAPSLPCRVCTVHYRSCRRAGCRRRRHRYTPREMTARSRLVALLWAGTAVSLARGAPSAPLPKMVSVPAGAFIMGYSRRPLPASLLSGPAKGSTAPPKSIFHDGDADESPAHAV